MKLLKNLFLVAYLCIKDPNTFLKEVREYLCISDMIPCFSGFFPHFHNGCFSWKLFKIRISRSNKTVNALGKHSVTFVVLWVFLCSSSISRLEQNQDI